MGVRGLFTFSQSHESFFENYELKDCKLVIDGNNLRYHLFNTCPRKNCAFGGDYDKYYKTVKGYFEWLLSVGVEPVVIMDGTFEPGKRRTVFQRSRDMAANSVKCTCRTQSRILVLPLFAKKVFLQAVVDTGVEVYQTDGEADRHIAFLASQKFKCHVLSNDSDFLVFEGVDLIELKSLDASSSTCRRFSRKQFLGHFGLDEATGAKLLPLAAALLGNDQTGRKVAEAADRVFSQVKHPPARKSVSPRHRRTTAILAWLGREGKWGTPADTALDRLLQSVPSGQTRDECRAIILEAAKSYSLADYEEQHIFHENRALKGAYSKALLPSWTLNVVRHKLFFLPFQVEDVGQPSSHLIALPIIKMICDIILADANKRELVEVKMVVRGGTKIATKSIICNPAAYCDHMPTQNGERLEMLMTALDTHQDQLKGVPEGMRLLFCALHYWTKHYDVVDNITQLHVASIFAATLHCKHVDKGDLRQIMVSDKEFDMDTIHCLANLQAVLYHSCILNRLLGGVLQEVPLHSTWNGTRIYNFIHCHPTVERFLQSLTTEGGEMVKKLLALATFASKLPEAPVSRKRTRNRTRRDKAKILDVSQDSDGGEEEEVPSLDFSDVNNRFALLSL